MHSHSLITHKLFLHLLFSGCIRHLSLQLLSSPASICINGFVKILIIQAQKWNLLDDLYFLSLMKLLAVSLFSYTEWKVCSNSSVMGVCRCKYINYYIFIVSCRLQSYLIDPRLMQLVNHIPYLGK